jgi:hypothetical protein
MVLPWNESLELAIDKIYELEAENKRLREALADIENECGYIDPDDNNTIVTMKRRAEKALEGVE